ncbi:alpha/beta hydrolase [Wenyingzhuangia sp. IMCC45533]
MKYLLSIFIFPFVVCCQNTENNIAESENVDNEVAFKKQTVVYDTIERTNPNRLSLDVYYQSNIDTKKPVVIYVHGGAWALGDKANQINNKVNLFESLNYVFVSINYRLSPFPAQINQDNRVKYPQHNQDVASAISWVYLNIESYGGNPDKIALMGHSAGAHLVALTATNQSFLSEKQLNINIIKGVVVIDTRAYHVVDLIKENKSNLFINAFGSDESMQEQASPILNIDSSADYPKFWMCYSNEDIDRKTKTEAFANELMKTGVSTKLVDGRAYNHSGINDAVGKKGETIITPSITAFLKSCLD